MSYPVRPPGDPDEQDKREGAAPEEPPRPSVKSLVSLWEGGCPRRPSSPVSSVSMRSDASKELSLRREQERPRKPSGPVSSVVSRRRDASKELTFTREQEHPRRPPSPVSSVKTDVSKNLPLNFTSEQEHSRKPSGPVSSVVSMRSDASMELPFRREQEHPRRPSSPVSSVVSGRSDASKELPFRREQEHPRWPPSPVSSVRSDTLKKLPLNFTREQDHPRTCITPHYTDPDLERHQLQDIQHQDHQHQTEQQRSPSYPRQQNQYQQNQGQKSQHQHQQAPALCKDHQKKLKFFCTTDQTRICSRCFLDQHKGHDAIELGVKDNVPTKGGVPPLGQLQFVTQAGKDNVPKKGGFPPPGQLRLAKVSPDSVKLRWPPPEGAPGPHSYTVTQRPGSEQRSFTTSISQVEMTGRHPGQKSHRTRSALSQDGRQSTPVEGFIHTGLPLSELLSALGLRDMQGGKLTLSSVLEINSYTLSDTPEGLHQLPWTFLRKLMMSNLNARNVQCDQPMHRSSFTHDTDNSDSVNPLDLITALFHCADPFLQQEMVSKMSMCQFAVPLLLPNCDTQQSTLMLWTMRDLVKIYKPHSSSGEGALVEGRIVEMEIPMVSFIRVGKSSLPKSQTLNRLLSISSQHNEAFIHHDMPCGNVTRRISDGLVEVSWYLPCGNRNIDIFTQPVAVANLRGDSKSFEAQMSFLCQTSAAVFIFSDDLEGDLSPFTSGDRKAELFLVTNSQKKDYDVEKLKETCGKHNIKETHVIIRKKQNESEFVKMLHLHVKAVVESNCVKTNMLKLADSARQIGILLDEDSSECRNARQNAEGIINMVKDVAAFKKKQLPLHGAIWKEISQLEKERYRLRKANREQDIEHYRSELNRQELELRKEQQQKDVSNAMAKFITGISQPHEERLYFLKWLNIQLDTLSRNNLSTLRQQYKDCCRQNTQNKDQIKKLDEQISNSSLGPEHFFRELGQIYECACSLQLHHPARQQVQHLPRLCAQMLLDGFPVELVDGDASNIPMKWISAVLTQLHQLVDKKSRILVLTVLGVQSTGKSTLLNTMFGVQFAVSSGRCTRGAFMLLMKVSEELRPELNCDFIMVIDTEGLKSPELAALDTSYEHDNELATLVIGLSDITIINVAMENNQEMKDVLQIAVHAFLRMKEVGKKPRCLFVHQNVSDMSAHDKNMRDRKRLVEQLNEMTQAAAKMEKKEANTKFTDVMKYDPDKDSYYIPGLWHGTPPMAPVNTGYSEAVYELKKNLICLLKSNDTRHNDATKFQKWTESLWNAVKFENFIFNFRNSLVADAYLDLCTYYQHCEWAFQKVMNNWLDAKTTFISNFGVAEKNVQMNQLQTILKTMLDQAAIKLNEEHNKILKSLDKYFEPKDNKVALVEKYRQEFIISAQSLRQQTESTVRQRLEQAVEIRQGKERVKKIKNKQTETVEKKVLDLIGRCRERGTVLSKDDLNKEFDQMWRDIMSELSNVQLQQIDIINNATHLLRDNLSAKGGHVSEILNQVNLKTSGQGNFTVRADWFSSLSDRGRQILSALRNADSKAFLQEKQEFCDDIVKACRTQVNCDIYAMEGKNTDYNDAYIKGLLNYIDGQMKNQKISDECEAYLKFYIIGFAARCFQQAHTDFNARNNLQECLQQSKSTFFESFLASFNEKDQCRKKAEQFAEKCVKPAVQDYVSRHLGQAIADEMKTGDEGVIYNTRTNFQFAILIHLLEKKRFKKYKKYTKSYETFMKDWIKQHVIQTLSASGQLPRLKKQLLSDVVKKINCAITSSEEKKDIKDIKEFIQQFCSALQDQLVIPGDALDDFMILISVDMDQFISNLNEFIKNLDASLAQEYDGRTDRSHISERIEQLPSNPHDLLFSSVCGCGHQCPFCGTPCEAGGKGHTTHFSSMHRPRAFGRRVWNDSNKLIADICTTAVISDIRFKSSKTNGEYHPYKEYREIYPDWDIAGDASVEASDYWKYVLMKFNKELAEARNANPADIPDEWKKLTEQDALTSLKKSFNME